MLPNHYHLVLVVGGWLSQMLHIFRKKTVEFAVPPPYTLYRETHGEGIYTREGIHGKGHKRKGDKGHAR